jgi:CDP-diacylglycerol--glycerol-3-phosphate 3-phosphatidyltransferase
MAADAPVSSLENGEGPTFHVPAACVTTLRDPASFYAFLLAHVASASARVTLSALYLGTGSLEVALARALRDRALAAPALRVVALFDYSRALRPVAGDAHACSAALLRELFTDGRTGAVSGALVARTTVGLMLMPQLRGLLGRLLPPRLREGAGVWHAKAYVFDDHTVLLSGANLSTDYFTTRQDRYVVVSSASGAGGAVGAEGVARLAAYLHGCVGAVAALPGAHALQPDGTVARLGGGIDGGGGGGGGAPPHFSQRLRTLLAAWSAGPAPLPPGALRRGLVAVRPRWQLGLLGVRADELALLALLRVQAPAGAETLHLATGYFNLPAALQKALIGRTPPAATSVHVLTAHPEANGFLGARGIAGAIPLAYCCLEKRFYDAAAAAGRLMDDPEGAPGGAGVAIHEYRRPGWTFHAKGLWLLPRACEDRGGGGARFTTVVGSSNYGERGLERDLELQVEFTSEDAELCARLVEERDALWGGPWVAAVGSHLVGTSPRYGADRNVWDAAAVPARALRWRLAWANGVWIRAGARALAKFF